MMKVQVNRFYKDAYFTDNIKAKFGNSSDAEIYHNGTHLYIDEKDSGRIFIRSSDEVRINKYTGEFMVRAIADGAVTLYHDNSAKIATTSTGVSVTGALTASGDATINNKLTFTYNDHYLQTGTNSISFKNSVGTSYATLSNTGLSVTNNLTVGGNLTVNGTSTTLNTATLDVEDKNITLNKGSGDTSSTADGAGITIQDAVDASTDASILWNQGISGFKFSHDIRLDDDLRLEIGSSSDLIIRHASANGRNYFSGGDIEISTNSFRLFNLAGNTGMITATPSGGVTLYHNGSTKLETTSSGVKFTGNLTAIDNQSILLGTDSDFRIRHTGTHSEITDEGTGHLKLGASTLVFGNVTVFEDKSNVSDNLSALIVPGATSCA